MGSMRFPRYYCLWLLVFFTRTDGIVNRLHRAHSRSRLLEVANYIIHHCRESRNGPLLFLGNWTQDYSELLRPAHASYAPFTLVPYGENVFRYKEGQSLEAILQKQPVMHELPAANVVMLVSAETSLEKEMEKLFKSFWWNHKAFFLLVGESRSGACSPANATLRALWKFNIYSAVYLCCETGYKVQLHTFNPYGQFAPGSWRIARNDRTSNGERFALFEKSIDGELNHSTVCRDLDFDKMANLYGYTIRAGTFEMNAAADYNDKVIVKRTLEMSTQLASLVTDHINASLTVDTMDKDIGVNELYLGIREPPLDLVLHLFFQNLWKLSLYPYEVDGVCMVSLKAPLGFFKKFVIIFTPNICFIILFIHCVSALILKRQLGEMTFLDPALDLLRMFVSTAAVKVPKSLGGRGFFITVIFYSMIISIYVQSLLSTLSILPSSVPTLDTFEDLKRSNTKMYGPWYLETHLFDRSSYKYYRNSSFPDCLGRLRNAESVTCMMKCSMMRYSVYENKTIHISNLKVTELYVSFPRRRDWPLTNKFDRIFSRISQSGLSQLVMKRQQQYYLKNYDPPDKTNLGLADLMVALAVLIAGWSLSILSLGVELSIRRWGKKAPGNRRAKHERPDSGAIAAGRHGKSVTGRDSRMRQRLPGAHNYGGGYFRPAREERKPELRAGAGPFDRDDKSSPAPRN